jgi:hypothetical protein
LTRERQLDAQRHEQVWRPRPQRDHGNLGIDRPFRGVDAPVARRLMQTQRIALHRGTAERLEPRCIGLGHRERIGDVCRQLPEHGAAERRRERRLEGARRPPAPRASGPSQPSFGMRLRVLDVEAPIA